MSRSARDGYGTSRQLTPIPLSRSDADPRNVLHEDDPSILVAGSSLISRSSSLWKGQVYRYQTVRSKEQLQKVLFGWKDLASRFVAIGSEFAELVRAAEAIEDLWLLVKPHQAERPDTYERIGRREGASRLRRAGSLTGATPTASMVPVERLAKLRVPVVNEVSA